MNNCEPQNEISKEQYRMQAILFTEAVSVAIGALELAIVKQPDLKKYFDSAVKLAKEAQQQTAL